jgi:hypothetical protein
MQVQAGTKELLPRKGAIVYEVPRYAEVGRYSFFKCLFSYPYPSFIRW